MRAWFGLLFLCACSTTIEPKSYDQKCSQDSDCVAVYGGDVCGSCRCPNAAINQKDLARYQKDSQTLQGRCTNLTAIACDCVANVPFCLDGACSVHAQ